MRVLVTALLLGLGGAAVWGADWLTDGNNPQRTNWQKDEKILTRANAKDIKLLWKLKLDNQPREMHALFPPLIAERVNTSAGPKQIAIETGVSDNIYAIDVETGKVIWKKHFTSNYTPHHRHAGSVAFEQSRQVHHLCCFVGWFSPPIECGRWRRSCSTRKIHAA
jgi:PQQ enzyme repeat